MFRNRQQNQRQLAVIVTLLLSLAAFVQWLIPGFRLGVIFTSWKWGLAFGLGILALAAELGLLAMVQSGHEGWIGNQVEEIATTLQGTPFISRLVFLLTTLLLPILILGPSGSFMQSLGPRLLLLWVIVRQGAFPNAPFLVV